MSDSSTSPSSYEQERRDKLQRLRDLGVATLAAGRPVHVEVDGDVAAEDVAQRQVREDLVVTTEGHGPGQRLHELLKDAEVPARLDDETGEPGVVQLAAGCLETGFRSDLLKTVLLTESDLTGAARVALACPPGATCTNYSIDDSPSTMTTTVHPDWQVRTLGPTLVVAPTSVVATWAHEAAAYPPGLVRRFLATQASRAPLAAVR